MNPVGTWRQLWARNTPVSNNLNPMPTMISDSQPFHQTTITGNNLTLQDAEAFSNSLQHKNHTTLCIGLHNVHFLPATTNHHKNYDLLNYLIKNSFNVFLLTEVGLNWSKLLPQDQWYERTRSLFSTSWYKFSYNTT